jgi:site-specific recombinase XerD
LNTLDAYKLDMRAFARWTAAKGAVALPAAPLHLAAYFGRLLDEGKRPSTLRRIAYAIRSYHVAGGYEDPLKHPVVASALAEARAAAARLLPAPPDESIAPALPQRELDLEALRAILRAMDARVDEASENPKAAMTAGEEVRDLRDRAIFTLTFAGALKRDELRLLRYENVRVVPEGLELTVNASPDHQNSARSVVILAGDHGETDPLRHFVRYLKASGITSGFIFRRVYDSGYLGEDALSQSHTSRMWRSRCVAAGLNPNRVSPQSFRSGFIVQCAKRGAPLDVILAQTGHKDASHVYTVLARNNLWPRHAQRYLGM